MLSLLARLFAKLGTSFTSTADRSRLRTMLGVTPLEDRTVPATIPLTGPNGGAWTKIDTITVSTRTNQNVSTGVASNVVLDAGVTYLAVVSGTARIATDSTGFADAEFIRYNKESGLPQDGSSPGYAWNNHGVRIAGVDGGNTAGNFWGGYQPDHQYVREVTGQGMTVRGWYSDIPGYYGDNSGVLTVNIYAEMPIVGTGTGLFGRYYVGKDFAEVRHARIDAKVEFPWNLGTPFDDIGTDEFSVRWTGKVQPQYTGEYTFYTQTDDGVKLWVNGKLLVDKWADQPVTEHSGKIELVAGQTYDIRMEYYENKVGAVANLLWSSARQPKQVVPQTQLYPNVATLGDRVWLDTGGNGLQDDGEAGAVGVRVQVFEGAEGTAEAVPAVTTDASGKYSVLVPAEAQYRLRFGGGDSQYAFTQQVLDHVGNDSDADATGMTAVFTAPSAGQSDLTRDAGLSALFDLDVNANGTLSDTVDGAANYLPGYEGDLQKLTKGAAYKSVTFAPQRMKLILEGVGATSPSISKVVFSLSPTTTSYWGYCSNKSSIGTALGDPDYSFSSTANLTEMTIGPNSNEEGADGVEIGGRMEDGRTWVNFYCKDYGGACQVRALIYTTNVEGGEVLANHIELDVPHDTDGDGIADTWEIQMAGRWSKQYDQRKYTVAESLTQIDTDAEKDNDRELRDPDATAGPLSQQADSGDAHDALEEYRGYVLDGGGVDGQGKNVFGGGHIRLDPARKEILLEVDRAAVLNGVPGDGTVEQNIAAMLNGTAKVFSNAERGAGISVYWLIDDTIDLPIERVNTKLRQRNVLKDNRNPRLASDFEHVLIIDRGINDATTEKAVAIAYGNSFAPPERGVVLPTSELAAFYPITNYPKPLEAFAITAAHELIHQLIDPVDERTLLPLPGFSIS